jgi:uncharacterized membrane protein
MSLFLTAFTWVAAWVSYYLEYSGFNPIEWFCVITPLVVLGIAYIALPDKPGATNHLVARVFILTLLANGIGVAIFSVIVALPYSSFQALVLLLCVLVRGVTFYARERRRAQQEIRW